MTENFNSKEDMATIPYFVHEADMARMAKTNDLFLKANKRQFILNIFQLFIILILMIFIVWRENQFEKVTETTTQEITQDTNSGGSNYNIIGGDYSNGEANNKNNEN